MLDTTDESTFQEEEPERAETSTGASSRSTTPTNSTATGLKMEKCKRTKFKESDKLYIDEANEVRTGTEESRLQIPNTDMQMMLSCSTCMPK